MVLSQLTVGWLILGAAILTFVGGFGMRVLVGRNQDTAPVQRVVWGLRKSMVGRVLFGAVGTDAPDDDALDDEELDQMILMPTIIVACGLCLTSVFLLGYAVLT